MFEGLGKFIEGCFTVLGGLLLVFAAIVVVRNLRGLLAARRARLEGPASDRGSESREESADGQAKEEKGWKPGDWKL